MLYFLDSDDLLERDLILAASASISKAIILRQGYKLDFARQLVTLLPRFWRRCGSSGIVDWSIDELPSEPLGEVSTVYRQFIDTRHYEWHTFCKNKNWSVDYIDRPIAAYVVNRGESNSTLQCEFTWKWKLYNFMTPGKKTIIGFTRTFRA